MNLKIIGAVCVIVACGGAGFLMAAQYLSNIRMHTDMIIALNYMESDLHYRCTPLPSLCRQASEQVYGKVRLVFMELADELEAQISPNAELCMASVLDKLCLTHSKLGSIFMELGRNLGTFDMDGQMLALRNVRNLCSEELKQLQKGRAGRVRSYQTLGLCAGAAIAILFV